MIVILKYDFLFIGLSIQTTLTFGKPHLSGILQWKIFLKNELKKFENFLSKKGIACKILPQKKSILSSHENIYFFQLFIF